jgi:hypothetical protein
MSEYKFIVKNLDTFEDIYAETEYQDNSFIVIFSTENLIRSYKVDKNVIFIKTLDNKITSFALSSTGVYALIKDKAGYKLDKIAAQF